MSTYGHYYDMINLTYRLAKCHRTFLNLSCKLLRDFVLPPDSTQIPLTRFVILLTHYSKYVTAEYVRFSCFVS
jgi:hypothetical protein